MSDLYPCSACRRHVRRGEEECPFCGEVLAAPDKRKPFAGKLTRAAIFAGAMAGGTATVACGPEPAPQSPDKVQQDTDQKEAEGPPDAGPVDLQYDPNNQPKPYGAPPARHRIV